MSLVTVIIPTYNRSKYVERAILSVAQQSYHDVELLVVDDGSTDDTRERVTALSHRIALPLRYVHQENQGADAHATVSLDKIVPASSLKPVQNILHSKKFCCRCLRCR